MPFERLKVWTGRRPNFFVLADHQGVWLSKERPREAGPPPHFGREELRRWRTLRARRLIELTGERPSEGGAPSCW